MRLSDDTNPFGMRNNSCDSFRPGDARGCADVRPRCPRYCCSHVFSHSSTLSCQKILVKRVIMIIKDGDGGGRGGDGSDGKFEFNGIEVYREGKGGTPVGGLQHPMALVGKVKKTRGYAASLAQNIIHKEYFS